MSARPISDDLVAAVIPRVLGEVTFHDGCWLWPSVSDEGYGIVAIRGRRLRVHRVTWQWANSVPVPDGRDMDHLCRNRACCNPNHLEPVTRSVNVQRGLRKTRQTHCKHGHALTPDNLVPSASFRRCLTCHRQRCREHQARLREAYRQIRQRNEEDA